MKKTTGLMRLMRTDKEAKQGLRNLIELLGTDLTGVEIGSYAGESAEVFATSGKFKTFYCVDFWKDNFYEGRATGEKEFDLMASKYPVIQKVKINSDNILERFKGLRIDFVYVDADHTYESVKKDIANALILLNGRGVIAGHDYIDTPRNPFGGVIKAVNEAFGKPDFIFEDTSWIKILK